MATIKKASKAKNISAGPSKKQPIAPKVDPRGQYTKVQERTLGNMKKGGKIKKAQDGKKVVRNSIPAIRDYPSTLFNRKKVIGKLNENAKSNYEGSSNPKVEYKTPFQSIASVDTTGFSAGQKSFPAKLTYPSGKVDYYPTSRESAKRAIHWSNKNKNGGVTKSKDGKWIQKAINPKHKGYCTPMTKATCTPKRKALAMTLKKMAKSRKGK